MLERQVKSSQVKQSGEKEKIQNVAQNSLGAAPLVHRIEKQSGIEIRVLTLLSQLPNVFAVTLVVLPTGFLT